MSRSSDTVASHVGEIVSLAPLGRGGTGRVLSWAWSPSLGEVLRLRDERSGQPSPSILLYGDLLVQLFPGSATPAA